jgi:hypothetical protein
MAPRDAYGLHPYGWAHQKGRKRWAPKVRAGKVDCWRCGDPIIPGAKWDLGHVDEDGRARGFPTRHPEHRACNRATVTILKRQLAEQGSSTPSRRW